METLKIFLMMLVQIGWFFAAFGLTYYIGKRIQNRRKRKILKYQIGNVVYVDFKRRGILTKGDIYTIEKRVDEINEALDLCTDSDDDVRANLARELDHLCAVLEDSLNNTKKRKAGK